MVAQFLCATAEWIIEIIMISSKSLLVIFFRLKVNSLKRKCEIIGNKQIDLADRVKSGSGKAGFGLSK
jgi:hypothetical protein